MLIYTYYPSSRKVEGQEVPDFKASVAYMRPYLKIQINQWTYNFKEYPRKQQSLKKVTYLTNTTVRSWFIIYSPMP